MLDGLKTLTINVYIQLTQFIKHSGLLLPVYRLVCDGWLEIRFVDEETASKTLSSLIHLRATWQNLLKLRLKGTASESEYSYQLEDNHTMKTY